MTTASRYDEIIVRNRSHRVRDVAFALLLVTITALAAVSIGTAGGPDAAHAAPTSAKACTVTVVTC